MRPITLGGRLGGNMASAAPKAANHTTLPIVLEDVPAPKRSDGTSEPERAVKITPATWPHVRSMGHAAPRSNITRRHRDQSAR